MADDRLLIFTGPSPRGWHRLQQFLECPQRYAWQYEAGLQGMDENAPPLVKGSLIHLGLAQHYARMREEQKGRDPERYFPPAEGIDLLAATKGGAWAEHAQLCKDVVEAYQEKWRNERLKIVMVEEMLDGNVGGHRFTGRLDLAYEDRQGRIWAMDHKSTGFLSSKQRKFYSVSGQILGYTWLARAKFGERFGGFRLNMIQHGRGEFKFERYEVDPAPRMLARWPQTVVDAEEGIAAMEASGRAPDNWPMVASELTCFHRYGACKFLEQCKWGAGWGT